VSAVILADQIEQADRAVRAQRLVVVPALRQPDIGLEIADLVRLAVMLSQGIERSLIVTHESKLYQLYQPWLA
jgi:hypothetical protein